MASQFSIFISHVRDDESIASLLKDFLQQIFLNADVFVASRDLTGGEIWVKEIRDCLKHATVILPVITPFSHTAPWVLFEAGAGFVDSRTIPICGDGITPENLEPPLKLLQARKIDDPGLKQLASDIAKRAELRPPIHFPGLTEALRAIDEFLGLRAHAEAAPPPSPARGTALKVVARPKTSSSVDPVIKAKNDALLRDIKDATIESITMAAATYNVPPPDELRQMEQSELDEIAQCFNLPRPLYASLAAPSPWGLPNTNDSQWKKMNAEKRIREGCEEVRKFLASLHEKTKSIRHAD